jgi:putative ABC transport system ATP-binding protein
VKPQYIHLEGIGKLFAGSSSPNVALHDINLVIERGEYVVLTGPSGSGKSTLLSLLGLLEDATSGSYVLGGRDVSSMSFSEKAKTRNTEIGFVFQNFNLIGELSVGDNVAVPLTFRSGMSAKERAKRVATALEQVGLAQLARGKPSELSGGEQQREWLSRVLLLVRRQFCSLMNPPAILIRKTGSPLCRCSQNSMPTEAPSALLRMNRVGLNQAEK